MREGGFLRERKWNKSYLFPSIANVAESRSSPLLVAQSITCSVGFPRDRSS